MENKKIMSYRDAINLAMTEEMRNDENIYLMGEDVGIYGGDFGTSVGMFQEFGKDRVIDTPISESAISGCAIGSAMHGLRPIIDLTFMDFVTIALDNIVNQGAKIKYMFGGQNIQIPATFRLAAGCGIGSAAQHSQSLESWLTHIPGLMVVAAGSPNDAKGLLKSCIKQNNITLFLEYKSLFNTKDYVDQDPNFYIPLGKAAVKNEGKDITIITYGKMVERCLSAAKDASEKENISVEVIDLRTLVPLDKETIFESVKKTGKVLIVNDSYKTNSYAAEISALISESDTFSYLDYPIIRLSGKDIPIPYAKVLEDKAIPSIDDIYETILKMFNNRV